MHTLYTHYLEYFYIFLIKSTRICHYGKMSINEVSPQLKLLVLRAFQEDTTHAQTSRSGRGKSTKCFIYDLDGA